MAFTVAFEARPGRWGHARLSDAVSRALDTAVNFFFSSPQDNADIAAEKGPSDNDPGGIAMGILRAGGAGRPGRAGRIGVVLLFACAGRNSGSGESITRMAAGVSRESS